jgi:hypothetical protein
MSVHTNKICPSSLEREVTEVGGSTPQSAWGLTALCVVCKDICMCRTSALFLQVNFAQIVSWLISSCRGCMIAYNERERTGRMYRWLSRYSDRLWAGRQRVRSLCAGRGQGFSLNHAFHVGSGVTQPTIQCVPGEISSRIRRPGREADHSPLTSAKLKNIWIYTSTPPYIFMA